jgi:hypothetical protein
MIIGITSERQNTLTTTHIDRGGLRKWVDENYGVSETSEVFEIFHPSMASIAKSVQSEKEH